MKMVIKLFGFSHTHLVRGNIEVEETMYKWLVVPPDASFETNKSFIYKNFYRYYYHEIIKESIVNLGIEI